MTCIYSALGISLPNHQPLFGLVPVAQTGKLPHIRPKIPRRAERAHVARSEGFLDPAPEIGEPRFKHVRIISCHLDLLHLCISRLIVSHRLITIHRSAPTVLPKRTSMPMAKPSS